MSDSTVVIVGTSTMIFVIITFILLVIWTISLFKKFKDFSEKRDLHYMERISGLESLIKKEFVELIQSLKI